MKLDTLESKIPPHSNDAEIAVLGSLLLDKNAMLKVGNIINEDSFYKEAHKNIYKHIKELFDNNIPVDLVTLTESLDKKNELEKIGGAYYISDISSKIPTAANVEQYAQIVREHAMKRNMIIAGRELIQNSYSGKDIFETISYTISKITKETEGLAKTTTSTPREWTQEVYKDVDTGKEKNTEGIKTNIKLLDDLLGGGYQYGDLILIAGRPSQGKTSFVVDNINNNKNEPVLFISLDQKTKKIGLRLLSNDSNLTSKIIKQIDYPLTNSDHDKIIKSLSDYVKRNAVHINDESWDIDDFCLYAKGIVKQCGIKWIIVDYLQQMKSRANKDKSRDTVLTYIAESLKILGKELNIPVLALSQLNRGVESRIDRRPKLSDLRESGGLEQAADVVLMMYNPSEYGMKNFPNSSKFNGQPTEGKSEIIIAKQKDGKTDSVLVTVTQELYQYKAANQNYVESIEESEF